jgi:1-acyl-sn-glycerol-3-phosphate acyltransferase
MQPYFVGDEYHTPANRQHHWGDKLAMNTRLYFVARYISLIIKARRLVARGRFDTEAYINLNWHIFNLIEDCNGRFHITGLDNIRHCTEPVVIVSNHMSNIESNTLAAIVAPYLSLAYVIKSTLLKFPVFGPVAASMRPIPVGRANPREDLTFVLNEGVARLKEGISVVLFPQSTRTVEFDPEKFNSLGVKLARKANVSLLPMVVKTDCWGNARAFWRDFGPLRREQPIHIAFGEPFAISGNGKEAHERVVAFIKEHLRQWGVPIIGEV